VHLNLIAFPATDPEGFAAPPELGTGIATFSTHRPAGSEVLLIEPHTMPGAPHLGGPQDPQR
jgi:hypothetical protein